MLCFVTWFQTALLSLDQINHTKGVNTTNQIHCSWSLQAKNVLRACLVSTDDHQSAAAVLCPAGQELSLLLWEGEDSEYSSITTLLSYHVNLSSSLIWKETKHFEGQRTLSVEWINILVAAAHFSNSLTLLFSLCLGLSSSCRCHFYFLLLCFLPDFHWFALLCFLSLTFSYFSFFTRLSVTLILLFPAVVPHLSSSSPVCWWTTSSRWGSYWRRCSSQWERNRWVKQMYTNTCFAPVVFNQLPQRPESLMFSVSTCSHWFHLGGLSLLFKVKMFKWKLVFCVFEVHEWKLTAVTITFFTHKLF